MKKIDIRLWFLGVSLISCQGFSTNKAADDTDVLKSPVTNQSSTNQGKPKSEQFGLHSSLLLRRLLPPNHNAAQIKRTTAASVVENLCKKHENSTTALKNVIFIMLDDRENSELWGTFRGNCTFLKHHFLKQCSHHGPNWTNNSVAIDDELDTENQKSLRFNIHSLLIWARQVRQMNTGFFLEDHFATPAVFQYKNLPNVKEEIPTSRATQVELESPNYKYVPVFENQSKMFLRPIFTPFSTERDSNSETWEVLKSFLKMRLAIVNSFVKSLQEIFGQNGDNFSTYGEPLENRSHFTAIMLNALDKLQSTSSENGYLLIGFAPIQELFQISNFLQHNTANDTLVILTSRYNHNDKDMPLLTYGPGSYFIDKAHTICDIPSAIRSTFENCRGDCRNQPSLSLAVNDTPRRRVVRSRDEDEMHQSTEEDMTDDEATTEIISQSEESTENTESSTIEDYKELRAASGASSRSKFYNKFFVTIFEFFSKIITPAISIQRK